MIVRLENDAKRNGLPVDLAAALVRQPEKLWQSHIGVRRRKIKVEINDALHSSISVDFSYFHK